MDAFFDSYFDSDRPVADVFIQVLHHESEVSDRVGTAIFVGKSLSDVFMVAQAVFSPERIAFLKLIFG